MHEIDPKRTKNRNTTTKVRLIECTFVILLRCFAIFVALLVSPLMIRAQTTEPTTMSAPTSANAVIVVLEGAIDDFERDALVRRFAEARATGTTTVILELDTNGGLVSSALDISRFLKQQTDLHTIAFIRNKAYSAGAMIAMACDEIVMQPNSAIGDCAPIVFRGDGSLDTLGPAERAKAESPVLADFRDSARRNGYDPLLAEAMVVTDRVVHLLQDGDGARRFVDDVTYKQLMASTDAKWAAVEGVSNPIDGAGSLLTVHSAEAVKIGLARGEFSSTDALARARGLRLVSRIEAGAGEAFVEVLASPLARMLFIVIFAVSLKIALATPGHGAPEAISMISLGLLVGGPLLTGHAQWWEIVAIFAGLALLAFEIFVFPGHFVSAGVGVVLVLVGLVATFVGREPAGPGWLPNLPMTWAAIQRGLLVTTGGLISSLLLWVWLNKYLPKLPYINRLVLAPAGGDAGMPPSMSASESAWPWVGMSGRAMTDLKPGGSATFHDSMLNETRAVSVVSDTGFVPAGTHVTVTESRGAFVVVRKK